MVRNHKWYELPRLVTVNDLYSFESEPEGHDRSVRRHHWPQLQAAEGRARLRQQPDGAHVADDDVPGSPAVNDELLLEPGPVGANARGRAALVPAAASH
jgi:hypothetical protein